MGAPNSLNLNSKVRVMKKAPGPSVSEEVEDIFRNYNIDNEFIVGNNSPCLYIRYILSKAMNALVQIRRYLLEWYKQQFQYLVKSLLWPFKFTVEPKYVFNDFLLVIIKQFMSGWSFCGWVTPYGYIVQGQHLFR